MAEEISNEMRAVATALAAGVQARRLPVVEPDEDEMDDLPPTLVSNGWVRMTIDGTKHKLRRPFTGEMEQLEAEIDSIRRELTELHSSMQDEVDADIARSKEIEAEAKGLNGSDPTRKAQLDDELTRLGVKALERSEVIQRKANELRAEWWKLAFELLTPPAWTKPDRLPAWVVDATLMNGVLEHWRSVPLAPGSA